MDIETKLKLLNANSFYGTCMIDRDHMIKEVKDILKKMKKESPEAFIDEFQFEQKEGV